MRRCGAYVQRTRTSRKYGLPQPYEPSKSKFNVTKFIAKIGPNKCERGGVRDTLLLLLSFGV